ncbi:MAG: Gfo/Idh/MocA family oxidoreductase [Clostridia bacterium]|nr:Gfo/Idh/MocA family oxidoreductase [Clostridia bacterium]
MDNIKVGVIGLGQRGQGLLGTMLVCDECEIVALCDSYRDRMELCEKRVTEKRGVSPALYDNYLDLINDPNVDAVVISSSWEMHTRMAVASMKAGKYTAVEVAGACDIEDCWQLVRTYEETNTPIMFLENCCFNRFELLATSLARAGRFGKILYCHGSYTHDLRDEILGGYTNRHYRLRNYINRNCDNYPTHELGPIAKILNINRGNKMVSLTSVSTKGNLGLPEFAKSDKNPDPSLKDVTFAQGDVVVTTITCAGGEVITLRLDTTLPRPYSREMIVQGTNGFCNMEPNMVMLEDDKDMHEFWEITDTVKKHLDSAEEYTDYLPDCWKSITEEEKALGHGGMDYLEFKAFFKAILNGEEMPIDVYDMAAWMAITPLSEASIALGGMPQTIPDFTRGKWLLREPKDVMELPNPKK